MLDCDTFKTVIDSTPLISIDIIIRNGDKVLLGKRTNKPAKGYFFSAGGRIKKNETIDIAIARIADNELNIKLEKQLEFVGIYEHFYKDSIYENISTHYVNLAFFYELEQILDIPLEQHSEFKWFTISELLDSKQVHGYTKDYFRS